MVPLSFGIQWSLLGQHNPKHPPSELVLCGSQRSASPLLCFVLRPKQATPPRRHADLQAALLPSTAATSCAELGGGCVLQLGNKKDNWSNHFLWKHECDRVSGDYHFPAALNVPFMISLCGSRGIYKLAQCSEKWHVESEDHFLKLNNPNGYYVCRDVDLDIMWEVVFFTLLCGSRYCFKDGASQDMIICIWN